MDQKKIGRFIAELRKEQQMTQVDLANQLGITDRAVSKWENGRGMPELSLIQPLCEALSISVNELLLGERIEQTELIEKAEETVLDTLDFSNQRIRKSKRFFLSVLTGLVVLMITLAAIFLIDINRMQNNKPVLLSTWGWKYTPAIDLHEEEIELAIRNFIVTRGDAETKQENCKTFTTMRIYLLQENKRDKHYSIYAHVLAESCYLSEGEIQINSSSFIPYKFTVEKQNDQYQVTDAEFPRDGSYYSTDLKRIFPYSVRQDMEEVYDDGTIEQLQLSITEQKNLYFHAE